MPGVKKQYKPRARKNRLYRRKRMTRRIMNSEFASAKETIKMEDDNMGALNAIYDVSLSDFDRLSAISKGYQFYRVTKIEVKFVPHADTFTYGSGTTVPTLYWLIDRNENILFSANGFDQIREAGAKPIRFDEKFVNISYKPSVLQTLPANNTNPPSLTTYSTSRLSPWLPTNQYAGQELSVYQWAPSIVPHRGIVYGVYQESPVGTTYQYHAEITLHVQFKKPNVVYSLKEGETFEPVNVKQLKPEPKVPEVVV